LAQSEDFSGVNKKLTNLFIEWLTAIVNKA
jgi:hypothetical protein